MEDTENPIKSLWLDIFIITGARCLINMEVGALIYDVLCCSFEYAFQPKICDVAHPRSFPLVAAANYLTLFSSTFGLLRSVWGAVHAIVNASSNGIL